MEENKITLKEIMDIFQENRRPFLGIIFLGIFISLMIALFSTPIYKAEVLLAPNLQMEEESFQVPGALGGLASFAGMDLDSGTSKVSENIAILKSYKFLNDFIKENQIKKVIFSDSWDEQSKKWLIEKVPSDWFTFNRFRTKILTVRQDLETGLVTLSIKWLEPEVAAVWSNDLILKFNTYMREGSILESKKRIEFLKDEINNNLIVSVESALNALLEKELKQIMLADSRQDYAFKIIDPAYVPEVRDTPQRRLIVLLGTFVSFVFAFILVIFLNVFKNLRNNI